MAGVEEMPLAVVVEMAAEGVIARSVTRVMEAPARRREAQAEAEAVMVDRAARTAQPWPVAPVEMAAGVAMRRVDSAAEAATEARPSLGSMVVAETVDEAATPFRDQVDREARERMVRPPEQAEREE